jgi:serine/threonine-protein kinase
MWGILTRDDPSAFTPPPSFGPFRVLHQVGVGALGPVFRTYEPTRDRLVAVKVFRLDITPEQAQALADELSKPAEAGLFHPSIVEPVAAGVEGTSAYRADEYVAAETLDVAMRHYAPAPVEKVLPFITQLAGAIDFARSAGIGHGALHPRDVFVTPEEARAGGFGVVDALERVGLRAPIRRPYTAPERIAGGKWGTPADVFSLAVIAYELITGRRPSGTGQQIAPITGGAQAAAVHAVIVRAMHDDPVRRYPTALAFASALDAAASGEAPAAAVTAVGVRPTDPDSGIAEVPPRTNADLRAEPSEAEAEESEFRASEPEFDDIAAAHEEDLAPAPMMGDTSPPIAPPAAADRSLFGHEAVDDLDIPSSEQQDLDRFSREFAAASVPVESPRATAPTPPPPRPPIDLPDDDEPVVPFEHPAPLSGYAEQASVVHQQNGIGIVPVVVTVVLALLVGFAAGYSVAGRATAPVPEQTTASVPPSPSTPPQQPAAKPYSEQAVTPPPSQPRSPVAETPAPSATPPPAPRTEPPPAKPAPEKITTGSVAIRSSPSGAGVTIDGKWRGRTPLTIKDIPFGAHVVRVVQSGYQAEREDVRLSAATPSHELSFSLQRNAPPPPRSTSRPTAAPPSSPSRSYAGSIYVDSRPRGARVLVDGKFMGTTPMRIPDVPIGSHVVRLQLEDHRDWTTSTRVTATQESRVTGSLERIR